VHGAEVPANYGALVAFHADWRAFERPPFVDEAPDYTAATFARRHAELPAYRARLDAIDTRNWPIPQQVDWHLVRAELNGFDFYVRVLKPWERDPAFYLSIYTEQSDTPAHEGPTQHAAIELWEYTLPLSTDAEQKLTGELRTIPPLLAQAQRNLTGNARDLWIAGTGTLRQQSASLRTLAEKTLRASAEFREALDAAQLATDAFVVWLERAAPSKTGPSGIGKEQYTWSLRNVHLVPLFWEEEVTILQRELARAHASLRLEEQRNSNLPPLPVIETPAEFDRRADAAVRRYLDFLTTRRVMPVAPYMDSALRPHLGGFVPIESRNFFAIATHYEPLTLYTHWYHWWDHARERETPQSSPIRREPLLYNIWDSRSEGLATAVEEMMMHAGLYDAQPRAREIVWVLLAQRAARGLASLYAQANIFTMKEAADFHVAWTPRGWMRPDLDLLGFEQQLYLRQPGYGTSYVTGKYQLEKLLLDRSQQLGEAFSTYRYFDEVNAAGLIPVSLIRWQMTGRDDEIRALTR
jgi:hypothetical protein